MCLESCTYQTLMLLVSYHCLANNDQNLKALVSKSPADFSVVAACKQVTSGAALPVLPAERTCYLHPHGDGEGAAGVLGWPRPSLQAGCWRRRPPWSRWWSLSLLCFLTPKAPFEFVLCPPESSHSPCHACCTREESKALRLKKSLQ